MGFYKSIALILLLCPSLSYGKDQIQNQIKTLPGKVPDLPKKPDPCPVNGNRITTIILYFYDFDGKIRKGKLQVFDVVARDVAQIFKTLYAKKFPIKNLGHSSPDPHLENVTAGYSCRKIRGQDIWSLHSYGLAIDVNPRDNPILTPSPKDPKNKRPLKLKGQVESIVPVFKSHGFFVWGGEWETPVDYMHFEVPRGVAHILAHMPYRDGATFYKFYKQHPTAFIQKNNKSATMPLADLYHKNPKKFMKVLGKLGPYFNQPDPQQAVAHFTKLFYGP